MTVVDIVSTGVANTASVRAAFGRLGCGTRFVEGAEQIRDAQFVVLPGVGAFDAAMTHLRGRDWSEPLRERVANRRPTLAICLGMQLFGTGSGEAPDDAGLDCVAATATRFSADVRVPHMGWSQVTAAAGCEILASGAAYFAHSFRWVGQPGQHEVGQPGQHEEGEPREWSAATADHGTEFVAAIESGPVVACQFHPELSGDYGSELLRRWLRAGGASW